MINIKKKRCNRCGGVKSIDEFHMCRSNEDGLQLRCKLCSKKIYDKNKDRILLRAKQYYRLNKEKLSERSKKYYRKNRDNINMRHKKYNKANKEKLIGYDKEYYHKNKERTAESRKKYREENKDKIAIYKKQHYENNKERVVEQRKQHYIANKGLIDICRQEYRTSNAKYELFYRKLTVDELPKLHNDGVSLEVKCRYCGQYFVPFVSDVHKRISALNGDAGGDQYLYCSDNCKQACPVYKQKKYPKNFKKASSREVNSLVRQMCFKRDDWLCQICGKSIDEVQLHCHHIEGYAQNPVLGNDIENVITLCKECHKEVHKLPGCNYNELRCN